MKLYIADKRELLGWIFSFSPGVQVISQPSLREKVKEEGRKVLENM